MPAFKEGPPYPQECHSLQSGLLPERSASWLAEVEKMARGSSVSRGGDVEERKQVTSSRSRSPAGWVGESEW